MPVEKKLGYRIGLALAPVLYKFITKLLFLSCRIEVRGLENIEELDRNNQLFIAAFWHYGLFYIMELAQDRSLVAMVSASEDGEYIAKILESAGFETVRGSRNRGAIAALRGLVSAVLKRGRTAAIVADGSQGPPLEAQAGAVLLASKTGVPIMPYGWGADRYFTFRSWDRTVLPKPFARIFLKIGDPLVVPPNLKSAGLEEYRLKLEKQLKENYAEVWGHFGIKEH
jgi:hypothetical protein